MANKSQLNRNLIQVVRAEIFTSISVEVSGAYDLRDEDDFEQAPY